MRKTTGSISRLNNIRTRQLMRPHHPNSILQIRQRRSTNPPNARTVGHGTLRRPAHCPTSPHLQRRTRTTRMHHPPVHTQVILSARPSVSTVSQYSPPALQNMITHLNIGARPLLRKVLSQTRILARQSIPRPIRRTLIILAPRKAS